MNQQPFRPEQPAWLDARVASTADQERTFIRSVYLWMFTGLMVTTGASLMVMQSKALQQAIFFSPL